MDYNISLEEEQDGYEPKAQVASYNSNQFKNVDVS